MGEQLCLGASSLTWYASPDVEKLSTHCRYLAMLRGLLEAALLQIGGSSQPLQTHSRGIAFPVDFIVAAPGQDSCLFLFQRVYTQIKTYTKPWLCTREEPQQSFAQ